MSVEASPFASWSAAPDCVVICGGKGTRLGADAAQLAKSMVPVAGRPMIDHIIEAWRPHVARFLLVVNHLAEQLAQHVADLSAGSAGVLDYQVIVERGDGRGIANALLQTEPHVRSDRFIMVLGDCLHRGRWAVPAELAQGVGVFATSWGDDIRRAYSVELDDDGQRITRLVEKPTDLPNDLAGTGFYFLERTHVFEHIRSTPPSPLRGQVEITDVLGQMVEAGLPLHAVPIEGAYVNVNSPPDLVRAARMLA